MNKQKVTNICLAILLIILSTGCGGDSSSPPEITDLNPKVGPPGLEVTIEGRNFSPNTAQVNASFNGTSAEVEETTPSEVTVVVPEAATTGPVQLTVDGETAAGPTFTVEAKAPAIEAIAPDSGAAGTQVTISGMNFGTTPEANHVTFDGTEALISSASETELIAEVPEGATTGAVDVTVDAKTATGPTFTVAPTIIAITPNNGRFGTEVAITGRNFVSIPQDNQVTFDGTKALVSSASKTKLIAEVPEGAQTGPVQVTIGEQTAAGPTFTIDPNQAFEGKYESQEYQLQIEGITDTTITVGAGSEVDIELLENSSDEIAIDLKEFIEDGIIAVDTALGGPGSSLIIEFDNDPIAEVTDGTCELESTSFEVLVTSDPVPGEISGEGVLEDNTLTLVFEYVLVGSDGLSTFSGEVPLEKQ